jgi:hypothetical protein
MNSLCRFLACGALCLLAALAQAQEGSHGVDARRGLDAQRHHPSQDQPLHAPENRSSSEAGWRA